MHVLGIIGFRIGLRCLTLFRIVDLRALLRFALGLEFRFHFIMISG